MVDNALEEIRAVLRARSGRDLSAYKPGALLPRIELRMQRLGSESMAAYARFLRQDPREWGRLLEELPIRTTAFLRDREAWESLRARALPELLAGRARRKPFRAWVAGCSTGEEAYSLAMLLREARAPRSSGAAQVLATDLDQAALAKARAGVYPAGIEADVSMDRIHGFFRPAPGGYRVAPFLRRAVRFLRHDLLVDAPLPGVDLASCRNLLIALEENAQRSVLERFHSCLEPGGLLFLGPAEDARIETGLFEPLDGPARLYRRR